MSGRIPSRGSDQFNLRLPPGMRERIANAASDNGRSMNAEIVQRLEWSFAAGIVEDAGSDIGRAMTWADHAHAMTTVVAQSAETMRGMKQELEAMRSEIAALRGGGAEPTP